MDIGAFAVIELVVDPDVWLGSGSCQIELNKRLAEVTPDFRFQLSLRLVQGFAGDSAQGGDLLAF